MKSWWEYLPGYPVETGPITVYEREQTDTGLLDGSGHPIYRLPEPIGFLSGLKADFNPGTRNEWHCRIGKVRWK